MKKSVIKKKWVIGLGGAALFVTAAAVILFVCLAGRVSDTSIVATVNGEPIEAREFRQVMDYKYVADTYNYFMDTYGAQQTKDFWTTQYGGQTPISYARKNALGELTRIKVQQILFQQNGLLKDTSYQAFLSSLKAENADRSRAVAEGQPVYGPLRYGEMEYYYYLLSNETLEYENILATKLSPTDDQLKAIYDKDGYTQSFNSMTDVLKQEYVQEQYMEMVDQLVKDAKVEINASVYDKIFT